MGSSDETPSSNFSSLWQSHKRGNQHHIASSLTLVPGELKCLRAWSAHLKVLRTTPFCFHRHCTVIPSITFSCFPADFSSTEILLRSCFTIVSTPFFGCSAAVSIIAETFIHSHQYFTGHLQLPLMLMRDSIVRIYIILILIFFYFFSVQVFFSPYAFIF